MPLCWHIFFVIFEFPALIHGVYTEWITLSLFRIVADSYERKSLILTTNLEFSKWGSVFTDEQMAAAMIDRLAHHGHLLMFSGRSYRMEHALMRQDAAMKSAS